MTREEAIAVLNMVEAHGSLVIQAKEMAIKALEQEPVLDKIRAEIEQEPYVSKMEVLDIIDEYRAGSER